MAAPKLIRKSNLPTANGFFVVYAAPAGRAAVGRVVLTPVDGGVVSAQIGPAGQLGDQLVEQVTVSFGQAPILISNVVVLGDESLRVFNGVGRACRLSFFAEEVDN